MKKHTLTKRIASVVLALTIVLSFALTSVQALPDGFTQVGTNAEFIDFDDGNKPHLTSEGGTTLSVSDKYAHSGTNSLAVADPADGHAKFYYSNGVKFEPNSSYYVSYWYYTDSDWSNNFAGMDAASGITIGTIRVSSTTNGQWNKVWYTLTTGDTVAYQYFRPQFYNIGTERTVYIDDFEVVQIESATGMVNTIPEDAVASTELKKNFENMSVDGISAQTSGHSVAATIDASHWGEASMKFQTVDADDAYSYGIYFNTKTSFSEAMTMEAGETYYFSYYVYSPAKAISHIAYLIDATNIVSDRAIPQGEWTKISTIFTVSEKTAEDQNAHLFRLFFGHTENNPVYLDDFVLAKLTQAPESALTAGTVDYNNKENTAVFTIESAQELSAKGTVTAPEGVTVDSTVVSDDNKSIEVSVSGVTVETEYALSVSGAKDVYGRTIADATVTFTTPAAATCAMEFASTSIPDGYTGVYAPVDAIYFTTPYALEETTVVAENFAIEGYKAEITAVELLSANEVKVSVSGIYPMENYKLSVDNVANTSGGILKDTLSFRTTTAGGQWALDFSDGTIPSGKISTDANKSNGLEIVEDFGHNDTKSVVLHGYSGTYNFGRIIVGNMLYSRTYLISFWYYSDTWKGDTSYPEWLTVNEWTFTSKATGQWNRAVASVTTTANVNGIVLSFWGLGEGETVYIDDFQVVEVYSDYGSPVIKSGDSYRGNSVGAGTTQITIPVTGDATAIQGYAAQYDENGRMLRAGFGTSTENAVTITIEDGEEVATKVFLWDAETNAPIRANYKYNY